MLLSVKSLQVSYGAFNVIRDVSIKIEDNQIIAIVGANGAGKSTFLRTIVGLLRADKGEINFMGERIDNLPVYERSKLGISLVPEGRGLFGKLSVEENLLLGAYGKKYQEKMEQLVNIYKKFPLLKSRLKQKAETLSGGEQQILAISRALMSKPKLLLLDEPSLGLMPEYANMLFKTVKDLREEGLSVLIVEQKIHEVLKLVDYGYVIQTGSIAVEGTGQELLNSGLVRTAFLGI